MKKSNSLLCLLGLFAASVNISHGQEDGQPAVVSGIQVLSLGVSDDETGEGGPPRIMQGAVMGGTGASFSFGSALGVNPNDKSQLFNLLSNESIQKELDITKEQIDGTKHIMAEARKRMQVIMQDMLSKRGANGGLNIDREAIRELTEENSAEAKAAIEEILKPDQLKRLKQLAYQIEVERDGLGESLLNGRLGREIGVYDGQKQHLLDRATDIDEQMKREIAQIKAEARAALLDELVPEQRKAAEDLLGAYFDYEEPSLAQSLRSRIRSMREGEESEEEENAEQKTNTRTRRQRSRN